VKPKYPSDLQLLLEPIVLKHGLLNVVEELALVEARAAVRLSDINAFDGAAEALSCAVLLDTLAKRLPGTRAQVRKAHHRLIVSAKRKAKRTKGEPLPCC
jgi:hypothetical protein